MTFNDNARIDTSGVQKRGGRGRTGAVVGGGSIITVIIVFLVSQFLGVDLSGMLGGGQTGGGSEETVAIEGCETGADANANRECRMAGAQNSLSYFWSREAPAMGIQYSDPGFVLYEGQTQSACGTASNAVGPFFCPADDSMYFDVAFFDVLEQRFGAQGGPLAEMYVVAHEWGHAMQYRLGILQQINNQQTGPDSDGVRLELQADCFAGAWVAAASSTQDDQGNVLLKPPSRDEINQALSAAAAVGDDNIQQQAGQQVNPEAFSHGSSEQRQNWFATGYQNGWQSCDTFSIAGSQL